MTTALTTYSTPRLSELARHLVYPDGIVTSAWPQIKRRLADMAVGYDTWQAGLGQLILGRDADDKYAVTVGGVTLSIPRQIGKTFTIGSLIVALCVEYPGLRVVWTSHHGRTTTNTFRSLQGMVRRPKIAKHLAPNGIRTANGEQEIKFSNGSLILFGAREFGFGVGIDAIDVLVCDEAQRLSGKALADMLPTTNQAQHPHGALLFFIGTPPRPTDNGDEFAARRRKATVGNLTRGIYVEAGADPDGDFDDPAQWRKANWSYPHRTPHEAMLRLRENLSDDDDWRREAMGVWDDDGTARPIPLDAWKSLVVDSAPSGSPSRYALAMSPNRVASIAVLVDGEKPYLDLAEMSRVDDSRLLVDWLVERCGRRVPVMIDSRDPAASFVNELRSRGVKVNVTTQNDMGKACGGLHDAVLEQNLAHCDQPAIKQALTFVDKKDIGKAGLWEFDIESTTADIAPLRALTLAHFGRSIGKPRTGRVVTL